MMIRPAAEHDIPLLLEMGRRFFGEAGWGDVTEYDPASMERTIRHLIDSEAGILLVAEADGEVAGMAGALLYPHYFNTDSLTGQEIFWWVEPAHRTGFGGALLDAMESAAAAAGAVSFTMVSVASLRSDALDRVYRRRGYRPAERTYIKRF
jgi:GNAT superfamily N-acetyltransferase